MYLVLFITLWAMCTMLWIGMAGVIMEHVYYVGDEYCRFVRHQYLPPSKLQDSVGVIEASRALLLEAPTSLVAYSIT